MREFTHKNSTLILTGMALGATAGAITTLLSHIRREIAYRGYPSWEECRCDFKTRRTFFQVLHSRHERRGETVVSQEWGVYLSGSPQWLRRLLHHSSQVLATLNPSNHYVERVMLTPQEAYQFAVLLHNASSSEEQTEEMPLQNSHVIWRREILHIPRYTFDVCIRRLYPLHISEERLAYAEPLPALWDPQSDLPLPADGTLLETPVGTRIDYIGWTPSQISFCTAHTHSM